MKYPGVLAHAKGRSCWWMPPRALRRRRSPMPIFMEHNLTIIPVISKIDLPNSRPDDVLNEMEKTLGIVPEEALMVSAKTGKGIDEIFDAVIKRIPPPKGNQNAPLRPLIFDSVYDEYRGVIVYLRIFDGSVKVGDEIYMMKTNSSFKVEEVGVFKPKMVIKDRLSAGEVGYCIANIKSLHDVKVGDTVTHNRDRAAEALPGYRPPMPMVYCGIYPTNNSDFHLLPLGPGRPDHRRPDIFSFLFAPFPQKTFFLSPWGGGRGEAGALSFFFFLGGRDPQRKKKNSWGPCFSRPLTK